VTEADIAGLPTRIDWKGQQYQLCPRDLAMQMMFANWVQEQAVRAIYRHRETLGAEGYERALAVWLREVAKGIYDWGSPVCHQALFTGQGLRYITCLKLQKGTAKHRGAPVDMEVVEQMFQDPELATLLYQTMLRQDFPNPERPVSTEAPAPA
jgi:hypothetical protein